MNVKYSREENFEVVEHEQAIANNDIQDLSTADDDYLEKLSKLDKPRIVAPTKELEQMYSGQLPCFMCESFDWEGGQKEIIKQRFFDRMYKEEKWVHLHEWINNPKEFGLCHYWSDRDGQVIVSKYSPGTCMLSDVDSSIERSSQADIKIPCPAFRQLPFFKRGRK